MAVLWMGKWQYYGWPIIHLQHIIQELKGDDRPFYSLNDAITAHLEALRDRKIEEEIAFLFPNPVFRVAGHVLWIAEIAAAEGKAIRSTEGFDEIGIELFDTFYGPVSLVGELLGRSSALAATV